MMYYDYHTHSKASFDGRDSLLELAKAAEQADVAELALTDHLDLCGQKPESSCLVSAEEFAKTQTQTPVSLVRGVELGQANHDISAADALIDTYKPEFVIAALHNLRLGVDFYYMTFDCLPSTYAVLDLYIDELFQLAEWGRFSVLAHITYPLRYVPKALGADFTRYYPRLYELFKILKNKGLGIEVNTSGFSKELGESLPGLDIVKLYKEAGGEIITLGSDAHRTEQIGLDLDKGTALLKEAGFNHVTRFTNGTICFEQL